MRHKHTAERHPKNEPEGAILWPRHQPYICGDRMRGTVILIMDNAVMEMTPEYAKAFADEMLTHAADVQGGGPSDNG